MAQYCYLDAHAALHPSFENHLNDRNNRIIVSEDYLAEMTRWEGSSKRIEHLRRLASIINRVYYAVDEAACLSLERKCLTLTNRSKVMLNSGTELLRGALTNPLEFNSYFSDDDIQRTIKDNNYNNPDLRPWLIRMVNHFGQLFRQHNVARSGSRLLTDEELKSIMGAARLFVRDQLIENGIPFYKAENFCKRDSCSWRQHVCIFSRIYDWTLRNGIEGLSEQQVYAEQADMRHVCLASYFDLFLTADVANKRTDENLRRAILLGRIHKRIAEVEEN